MLLATDQKSLFILGTHFGDEGKGKIVDVLASRYRYAVRFAGGNNAGHTLYHQNKKIILHLIPSAVLHPEVTSIISQGVVLDPVSFKKEVDSLASVTSLASKQLLISGNVTILFSCHRDCDFTREQALGKQKIGTTGKGIGPAYEDIPARRAIRAYDLFESTIEDKLAILAAYYAPILDLPITKVHKQLIAEAQIAATILDPYLCNTTEILKNAIKNSEPILFEGAQGAMLDLQSGSWPYVTSSTTTSTGIFASTRLPPTTDMDILGICKAYTTRVGNGPLPSEIPDPLQSEMVKAGAEFGSTTGRQRRCGWLDIPILRQAVSQNAINQLCVTKIDVLDDFDELRICTSYQLNNKTIDVPPDNPNLFSQCKPNLITIPGWNTSTQQCKTYNQLPSAARNYLAIIEKETGVPIRVISNGKNREDLIWCRGEDLNLHEFPH